METGSLKISRWFCSVESSELVPRQFLSAVFHDVIKGLRGHPGRGQRTRVHVSSREPVEPLQQDVRVASGP